MELLHTCEDVRGVCYTMFITECTGVCITLLNKYKDEWEGGMGGEGGVPPPSNADEKCVVVSPPGKKKLYGAPTNGV
jgi:hypothetical protein